MLIDLMNKVYVTHPDLLVLCCQLLAQCPTQHHGIQVSSIIGEGVGERGRRGGGRLRRGMGGGERVMMMNLRTDCDVPSFPPERYKGR